MCDWFAGDGFAAVAPATYDRTERNKVFATTIMAVCSFANILGKTVLLDIGGCAMLLRQNTDKIAIAGFCTGGTWAWIAADRLDMDAAVIFYGSERHDNLGRQPKCPAILHYGDADHVVAFEQVQKIQTTYRQRFLRLPGAGHAFYNPEQAHHDPEAAKLAHQRSVEFLEKHFA